MTAPTPRLRLYHRWNRWVSFNTRRRRWLPVLAGESGALHLFWFHRPLRRLNRRTRRNGPSSEVS